MRRLWLQKCNTIHLRELANRFYRGQLGSSKWSIGLAQDSGPGAAWLWEVYRSWKWEADRNLIACRCYISYGESEWGGNCCWNVVGIDLDLKSLPRKYTRCWSGVWHLCFLWTMFVFKDAVCHGAVQREYVWGNASPDLWQTLYFSSGCGVLDFGASLGEYAIYYPLLWSYFKQWKMWKLIGTSSALWHCQKEW